MLAKPNDLVKRRNADVIFRIAQRDQPFAQIDKRSLCDKTLSLEAKGLLSYLLSKPDDWQVRLNDMIGQARGNVHAVRRALRELRARGYARLLFPRRAGKVRGSEWIIHERPSLRYTNSESQKSYTLSDNELSTDNEAACDRRIFCRVPHNGRVATPKTTLAPAVASARKHISLKNSDGTACGTSLARYTSEERGVLEEYHRLLVPLGFRPVTKFTQAVRDALGCHSADEWRGVFRYVADTDSAEWPKRRTFVRLNWHNY